MGHNKITSVYVCLSVHLWSLLQGGQNYRVTLSMA